MRCKLIEDIARVFDYEIPPFMEDVIDHLMIDLDLSPYDTFVCLMAFKGSLIECYMNSNPSQLEIVVKDQRKCVDRIFKDHTSNISIYKQYDGRMEYKRENNQYPRLVNCDLDGDLMKIVQKGTEDDPHADINEPTITCSIILIYACYVVYGYNDMLESDINQVIYTYSDVIEDLYKELKGE